MMQWRSDGAVLHVSSGLGRVIAGVCGGGKNRNTDNDKGNHRRGEHA